MPKIVLIRHAHSTANAAGVLSGQLPDVHLSKSGKEQAERLAERLGKLTISQVQVSPMDRCSETLVPWLAKYGKNVNVIMEPNLVEVDYGKWTGKKLSVLALKKEWRVVQNTPSAMIFPEGESLANAQERAKRALMKSIKRAGNGTALLVSHGDVIKSIVAAVLGTHLDNFQKIVIDPASITVLDFDGNDFRVLTLNNTSTPIAEYAKVEAMARRRKALLGGGSGRKIR